MLKRWLLLVCLPLASLCAQENTAIPAVEIARAPTPARVAALVDLAAAQGWVKVTPTLRTAAQQAYETRSGYAASWFYLYRWSRLFGTPYNSALDDWVKTIVAAKAGHHNMPERYAYHDGFLSADLTRELQLALLANAPLSEEFFQLLSPLDSPAEVLAILQKIHRQDPVQFGAYGSLALAIAVVYDVPAPPQWPHGQVSPQVLSRQLPPPEQVFAYFVRLDRSNSSLQRLSRLPASELKFLVDNVAPFSELDWARKNVPPGLGNFADAYAMVKYRKDRLAGNVYLWPGADYTLPAILQQGGICVDQAYFASMAGKAKGTPTIMFRGAGLDGRHAWFGYLDAMQRWRLDCGRYAEQKYVVGLAFDPQTWTDINDHELLFITERFRALPTYKLSVINEEFASDYLAEGKIDQAIKAAREAANREPRNLDAWNTLLRAQAAKNSDARAREAILREATLALQRYPDLEISFSRQLMESLRARGEGSLAQAEEYRLSQKYQANREDLTIEQAAAKVKRSTEQDDLPTQISIYNRVVDTAGRGAGIDFYDKVVRSFVTYLADKQQIPAALQAMDRARRTLRVDSGKQLDLEMTALSARLKSGNIPKKAPGP